MTPGPALPVVILSTADFDSPVMTNKQHLALGLALSRPVTYIESLGLRRPTAQPADLKRIARRALGAFNRKSDGKQAPTTPVSIVKPIVVPLHEMRLARAINSQVMAKLAAKIPHSSFVLWSFSPITYGLERSATRTVYHSVDLLHAQPRMPASTLLAAEKEICRTADAVIASSSGVQEHLQGIGAQDVRLWENVADTELFASQNVRRESRAIFAGNLSPTKVDFGLLERVADADVPLALAGPIAIDGTNDTARVERLIARSHVTYLGNLEPQALAGEVARSSVGLIPYELNPYTSGVFPLKVYEYQAAGLAVVATRLPSLSATAEIAFAGQNDFHTEVRSQLHQFSELDADRRRVQAIDHSWTARFRQVNDLLESLSLPDAVRT